MYGLLRKDKVQYVVTLQVSGYCILALCGLAVQEFTVHCLLVHTETYRNPSHPGRGESLSQSHRPDPGGQTSQACRQVIHPPH